MCGRFVSASPPAEIAAYFGAEVVADLEPRPNFNVAPTTDVLVVYDADGERRLDAFRWGLVPTWAKDLSIGSKMINARAETVAEKNAFRSSFAKRRCIVPATGFYEWKATVGEKRKQPFFIHRPDGEPYAFAGLWAQWTGTDAEGGPIVVRSTTIITCIANEAMSLLHDRMPVMLAPSDWSCWLDPDQHDTDVLTPLLVPAPSELIAAHEVSTDVNSVRNNRPDLIDESEPVTLF